MSKGITSTWCVECIKCKKEGPETNMGPQSAIVEARHVGWHIEGRTVLCVKCRGSK